RSRAERTQPRRLEAVDEPARQRQLRADDGQVDRLLLRVREQAVHVVHRDRCALGELRDARVAGGAEDRARARALRELPDERVLAPAPTNDQDAHESQCRKCRTPVISMAAPSASAARMTSSSRLLPPGWTTARAPAFTASSSPSGNGK